MSDSTIESKKSNRLQLRQQVTNQNEIIRELIDVARVLLESRSYRKAESVLQIVEQLDKSVGDVEQLATALDQELVE